MRTVYVWCPVCEKVVAKSYDGCQECGTPPRFSRRAEQKQATALMGARAASNLNAQAEHAVKHT